MMKLLLICRFSLRMLHAIFLNFFSGIVVGKFTKVSLSTRLFVSGGGEILIGSHSNLERFGNVQAFNFARLRIGSQVFVNKGFSCVSRDSISIGDRTIIGPYVSIYDHNHSLSLEDRRFSYRSAPVWIGEDVWIGAGVTILKGVTIGSGSVIGANVVVRRNVAENEIVLN